MIFAPCALAHFVRIIEAHRQASGSPLKGKLPVKPPPVFSVVPGGTKKEGQKQKTGGIHFCLFSLFTFALRLAWKEGEPA